MDIALKSVSSPRQSSSDRKSNEWSLAEKLFVGGFFAFVVAMFALAVTADPEALISAASAAANVL